MLFIRRYDMYNSDKYKKKKHDLEKELSTWGKT